MKSEIPDAVNLSEYSKKDDINYNHYQDLKTTYKIIHNNYGNGNEEDVN